MNFIPEPIDDYVNSHSGNEPELLADLRRETHLKVLNPRMLSGIYQGRVLSLISKLIQPELILEIGTYTAYSALCLAEGLKSNGTLHTIDINDELRWIREKYINQSDAQERIKCHEGDALTIVPDLNLKDIDLVFIDADKSNYIEYYNLCLPAMKPGGLILIDNVLWSGKVLEVADENDADTITLQKLNDLIQADESVEKVMIPVRDGLYLVRKI